MGLFPLFTQQANDEALTKMNPRVTKSMWVSPTNTGQLSYGFQLDPTATIYTVTKE